MYTIMKKILAIGAHSDDIEFYAGGTLAKMAKDNMVKYVIATDGRNGTHNSFNQSALIKKRKTEQVKAGRIIGVKEVVHWGFEDGELEFNIRGLKKHLLDLFISFKPDVVFGFDPEKQFVVHDDYHPDHRALALATIDVLLIDATLPTKGGESGFRPQIYLFNSLHPNYIEDIRETMNIKTKALVSFASQQEVIEKQVNGKQSKEEFRIY